MENNRHSDSILLSKNNRDVLPRRRQRDVNTDTRDAASDFRVSNFVRSVQLSDDGTEPTSLVAPS